ncbi:MAG TPA: hypothetical protein VL860_08230, partial [Planctomycetota bacterium]|nr:hypothetical protein [Planctomycetota bacterium]
SWYAKHKALPTKDAQEAFVDEYIYKTMQKNTRLKTKQDALKQAATIVPVALDLGIARLTRAQEIADPAQRKAELLEVEKLFLGMEQVAGQSDEYHLFYGQVCYWLGKMEEGHKQFDDLLTSTKRAPGVLIEVAERLRSVGKSDEATTLAEEAYAAETDPKKKLSIAQFLAVACEAADEKLKWLKLSDPADPWVATMVNSAEGMNAQAAGDREKALDCFKKVEAALASLPKTALYLNESGLNHHRMYYLNYDHQALDRAIAEYEESVQLSPKESIEIDNLVISLSDVLKADLFGNTVDFARLGGTPTMTMTDLLYTDQKDLDELIAKLKANPAYPKLITFASRLATLAPESPTPWSTLMALYTFTDDHAANKEVLQRYLSRGNLPEPAVPADYYRGDNDELLKAAFLASLKAQEGRLEDVTNAPATEALLITNWADSCMRAAEAGVPVDGDQLLKRSQHAHQVHPCYRTAKNLMEVHYFRCVQTLAAHDADFAALARRERHVWEPGMLLAWTVCRAGPQRDAVLADKDFKTGLNLQMQRRAGFPTNGTPVEWALVNQVDATAAARLAKNLTTSPHLLEAIESARKLRTTDGNTALDEYLLCKIAGKDAEARTILATFRDRGIPLPDPK